MAGSKRVRGLTRWSLKFFFIILNADLFLVRHFYDKRLFSENSWDRSLYKSFGGHLNPSEICPSWPPSWGVPILKLAGVTSFGLNRLGITLGGNSEHGMAHVGLGEAIEYFPHTVCVGKLTGSTSLPTH